MLFAIDRRCLKGSFLFSAAAGLAFVFRVDSLGFFFLLLLVSHLSFFRDPKPRNLASKNILSPAEGTVVEILNVQEDRFIQGPAVRIGIFLSIFDAHVNRAPMEGEIEYFRYEPGKFLNAMKPESARENESVWMGIRQGARKLLVRAISGAIARRICSDVTEKQSVPQGGKLGIICYGSRTELYLPENQAVLTVQVGQKVKVGQSILGEWKT